MIEPFYDLDNLYKAFLSVKKQSGWKSATQRYEEDVLFNLIELQKKLVNKTYKPTKPITFPYRERGKLRIIESYIVEDRIVQSCFINDVLLPLIRPHLVYDNSASLEKRGTDFFRDRLYKNLKQISHKYGNDCYILKYDFTKYFDNLRHDNFYNALRYFGADEEVIWWCRLFLVHHIVDVSYMTDDEYKNCMNIVFNSIEYLQIDKNLLTGEKLMYKSMGIGSPIAQIGGIVGAYKIDNYIKYVCGIKPYGRYMDDGYVIDHSKERLKELEKEIEKICLEEGIFLNKAKTQIIPLSHEFTILKTKYHINSKGAVIVRPDKKAYKRQRHKLKRFKKKCDNKQMTIEDVDQSQKSWRGSIIKRFGVTQSLRNVDNYYNKLFKEKP